MIETIITAFIIAAIICYGVQKLSNWADRREEKKQHQREMALAIELQRNK